MACHKQHKRHVTGQHWKIPCHSRHIARRTEVVSNVDDELGVQLLRGDTKLLRNSELVGFVVVLKRGTTPVTDRHKRGSCGHASNECERHSGDSSGASHSRR